MLVPHPLSRHQQKSYKLGSAAAYMQYISRVTADRNICMQIAAHLLHFSPLICNVDKRQRERERERERESESIDYSGETTGDCNGLTLIFLFTSTVGKFDLQWFQVAWKPSPLQCINDAITWLLCLHPTIKLQYPYNNHLFLSIQSIKNSRGAQFLLSKL